MTSETWVGSPPSSQSRTSVTVPGSPPPLRRRSSTTPRAPRSRANAASRYGAAMWTPSRPSSASTPTPSRRRVTSPTEAARPRTSPGSCGGQPGGSASGTRDPSATYSSAKCREYSCATASTLRHTSSVTARASSPNRASSARFSRSPRSASGNSLSIQAPRAEASARAVSLSAVTPVSVAGRAGDDPNLRPPHLAGHHQCTGPRTTGQASDLSTIGRCMNLDAFPRHPLLFGPSPVHRLERLTGHLGGAALWAKREDCNSGLAFGGNKTRKLEYLVADALVKGSDTLVSIGGVQSNHTRQVAAVAARLGLRAVLVQEHWVDWPDVTYDRVGNIQLSRILGAEVRLVEEGFGIGFK